LAASLPPPLDEKPAPYVVARRPRRR
jgi:hypothetical protein